MAPLLMFQLPFFFPCAQQCVLVWHGGIKCLHLTAHGCIPFPVSRYDHLHLLRDWLLALYLDLCPQREPCTTLTKA